MEMQTALEASHLSKSFGNLRALDNLNLRVQTGQIYALLGANGAGKTTTISLFLKFLAPTSGQVFVLGQDIAESSLSWKKNIAYIPELVHLYGHLTGIENLRFFAALSGNPRPPLDLLHASLLQAGLPQDALRRRVSTYSKGMRQKVAIAVAILRRAQILLLDEPTSGLDPSASNEFSRTLEKLRSDGVAVLMATHDLFNVKQIADKVGIMHRGQLVSEFQTRDLDYQQIEKLYLHHSQS